MRALFARTVLSAAMMFSAVATAHAQSQPAMMTMADHYRLMRHDDTRTRAMQQARDAGSATDLATLDTILSGDTVETLGAPLDGQWRCRVAKLGKISALIIYDYFKCRIDVTDAGLRLEKLTGSQRTSGLIYSHDDGDPKIYRGTLHYGDEQPLPYPHSEERDQIAYVHLLSDGRIRLEFPEPFFESDLDILELVR